MARTFSTRELAQMWNVSESTVKRWADSRDLDCYRTPGGHRRFSLKDIHAFQMKQGFEANGLLKTEEWEDPDVETSLNKKDFDVVGQQVFYLASQNQHMQIRDLLMRLFLRGVTLAEIYDKILGPVTTNAVKLLKTDEISQGQAALINSNLEEALLYVFPQVVRRQPNGKTGLCATPDIDNGLTVSTVARILEIEGWECLNLGRNIPFDIMAEMVSLEPVNLVCVVSTQNGFAKRDLEKVETLSKATSDYRIPLLAYGNGLAPLKDNSVLNLDFFESLKSLRSFVVGLSRQLFPI